MKALVTGSAGFVASWLIPELQRRGYEVHGIDIKSGNDARDFFRVDDTRYDLVVHLAAVVGGRLTIEGAPLAVAVDLAIDAELYQWALCTRPGKIVYYSSSAAYPIAMQTRSHNWALQEDFISLADVRNPDMTYGWVKLTGEMLATYAREKGLDVLVLRPFSGYGENQSLDYPFPSFIDRAVRRCDPFEIWGDGTQVRDWIHISDVVDATMEAIAQKIEGPVNVGTGRRTSFNELADMVCEAAAYKPELKHVLDAPEGVHTRYCDSTYLRTFYEPQVSLEQGIDWALRARKSL